MDKIWAKAKELGAFSPENLAKAREWEEEMRKRKKNLPAVNIVFIRLTRS
jgi:hypothetical protein